MNQNNYATYSIKETTQIGLLERPLTYFRTNKIIKHCLNKNVLDFGCGVHLRTLLAIKDVAAKLAGVDQIFGNDSLQLVDNRIYRTGNLNSLNQLDFKFDVITSLACFEHLYEDELVFVLQQLRPLMNPNAKIIGTVPTPAAKPVLEFLSYKLGLIDPSQIEDHKVYYNKERLASVAERASFQLVDYKKFQFGMNSFFTLE